MKRAATLFALAALLGSCRQAESPLPSNTSASGAASRVPAQPLRVGLLTPGSINDGGWNALAYEGLELVHKQLGAEVSHQEAKTPAEIDEGFNSYGAKGFDLVFGHGFEFQDPAMKAGKQHPRTIYITTSGTSVAPNVSPMVFQLERATYLLGIIAARESKSGKAGVVGGIKLPSIESTFKAFEAGAHSVDPHFEVKQIYTGNFDDVSAARVATLSLINAGCDFIFHQANDAARGVFQACTERNVRCFGSNKDQKEMAPNVIVASAVLDVPKAFLYMGTLVHDHKFEPHPYLLGMNEGIISLVWNDKLKATMKPATVTAVEQAEKDIRSGKVVVARGF